MLEKKFISKFPIFINTMKLLLFLVVSIAAQGCPGFDADDLLQSGMHVFFHDSSITGDFSAMVEVPVFFKIPSYGLQVAVSTSAIPQFHPANGLEYHVRGTRKAYSDILRLTLEVAEHVHWTSMQVSYLASSREDFSLGSVRIDPHLYQYQGDGTVLVPVGIPFSNVLPDEEYDVAIFISGLTTNAASFLLHTLDDSFVDSAAKTLIIHFEPKAFFSQIIFAYVIYPKVHPIFTIVQDDSPNGDGSYQLAGVSDFRPHGLVYQEFKIQKRFIFCNGSKCPSSCIIEEKCEPLGGHLYQNQCFFCPDNKRNFQAGICRFACNQKEVWYENRICVCQKGYIRAGSECVPNCNLKDLSNTKVDNQCNCIVGHREENGICVPDCQDDELVIGGECVPICGNLTDNKNCVCPSDQVYIDGACEVCSATSVPNAEKTSCICNSASQIFIVERKVCEECPANSSPDESKKSCECNQGYREENGGCVLDICPENSKWNKRKFQCECSIPGEHLIDQKCRACQVNEFWNGKKCVCDQGFYRIFGVCRNCNTHSYFNGTDCECNYGYYGNRDLCQPCHKSCGTCSGPQANQCRTCAVNYTSENGFCKLNCPSSHYLFKENCQKCTDYCQECENLLACKKCVEGFEIRAETLGTQEVSFCVEKCGDGKRLQSNCDDGNTDDGDGCSSECKTEDGWTCFGGSPNAKSTCLELVPVKSPFFPTGILELQNKVIEIKVKNKDKP